MVPCVLPDASQWDEGLQAKMLQLHERGLRPQLFLPQAWVQRHLALEQGSRCAGLGGIDLKAARPISPGGVRVQSEWVT